MKTRFKKWISIKLMTPIDFTLSNARQFYSSMENPSAVKALNIRIDFFDQVLVYVYILQT